MSQQGASFGETTLGENRAGQLTGYGWVILGVVWLMSVAAALNQFKVPPLIPVLTTALEIDLAQAGLLMSVFAFTGLILALPAGVIVHRLGVKTSGLIATGCLVLGAAWGAVAGGFAPLLVSRVLEGIGMGLIAVAGPAAIALWFAESQRGTPMGIWATWVPVGNVVMLNLAPALQAASGWQAVWWAGSAISLVAFALYGLLMRPPPGDEISTLHEAGAQPLSLFGGALTNRNIWLLAVEFACFNVVFIGLFTFFPTFLVDVRQYSLAEAGLITSLATLASLPAAPVAGWLSDQIGSRRLFIAIPFLVFAALLIFPFHATGWSLYALIVVVGAVASATPTATFAAAPEVMGDPRLAGIGMAVVAVGMNLGIVLGPTLFGTAVDSLGWAIAGYLLIPVSILGFLAAWALRVR